MLGPQYLDETRDYALTLRHPKWREGRNLAGKFTGEEEMVGRIWSGEDQALLAQFTAAWDDEIPGNPAEKNEPVIKATVAAESIEDIPESGTYDYRVVIPATNVTLARGKIQFRDPEGTAVVPAVYGTRKHLLDIVPWLEKLEVFNDTAGFRDARGQAREWVEDAIFAHAPRAALGDHLVAPMGWSYPGRSTWLAEQLEADALIVSAKVREAVSLRAAGMVLIRQVDKASDGESYAAKGARFLGMANDILATTTVELDTDGDGEGDIAIPLGNVPTIRG